MSIILNTVNNMSEADKEKLGKVGTKLSTDGEHLLTIVDAYEITWQSPNGTFPTFVLKCENAEGKTVEWSAILQQKVGKDDKGVVKAGEYSVNGVKTYLDNENAVYDNLRAIGQIKNLWKIVGLDEKQFGAGVINGTVQFAKKGVLSVERWQTLIGKKFTGVTSYVVSLDQDGKRAWRNQELNMDALFTAARLSQVEVDAGKTEPAAIELAVATAKSNASIAYKDRQNKICIQELQLIKGAGKAPAAEDATKSIDADIF